MLLTASQKISLTMAQFLRVQFCLIHEQEWHTTLDKCTIPSRLKWASREGNADSEGNSQRGGRWKKPGDANCLVLIHVSHHTSHNNWNCSSGATYERRPGCRLDLLHLDVSGRVRMKQQKQKVGHDYHCHKRLFTQG